jgi:hypothetical protein
MLNLSSEQARYIAHCFQDAVERGLAGLPSYLKMLPNRNGSGFRAAIAAALANKREK